MIELAQIRRELLRAARGKRSQEFVNRRLGVRFNQMYRWERGSTRISWPDFVRLCGICKLSLTPALEAVLGFYDEPSRSDLLVRWLVRVAPRDYLASVTGLSRSTIEHWSAGRSVPSLDDILLLVHRIPCALVELVDKLVSTSEIPSMHEAVEARRARAAILAEVPAVEALLAALELDPYRRLRRHDDALLAVHSGIEPARIAELLGRLEALGVVALRRDKYVIEEPWLRTFDIRRDFHVIQNVKRHWLEEATKRVAEAKGFSRDESFSYFVFSASCDVVAAVLEEYLDLLKRIIARVEAQNDAKTGPRRHTRVLGIQLFSPGRSEQRVTVVGAHVPLDRPAPPGKGAARPQGSSRASSRARLRSKSS